MKTIRGTLKRQDSEDLYDFHRLWLVMDFNQRRQWYKEAKTIYHKEFLACLVHIIFGIAVMGIMFYTMKVNHDTRHIMLISITSFILYTDYFILQHIKHRKLRQ